MDVTEPTIELLESVPDAAWNAFVDAHPEGTLFHLSEWGAVYEALSWVRPFFLAARRSGSIVGLMPLAVVSWLPGRRALVSAPYCVEAGAIAADETTRRALENAAVEHARSLNAAFVEVRQGGRTRTDWDTHEGYAGFRRAISDDEAANLRAIPRKQRAMIRKGEAAGLRLMHEPDPALFYRLYATSMRNLGTPAYPPTLFAALREAFGERIETLAVGVDAEVVAAVMSFRYKDTILPYYAGSLPRARALKAFDYLYWRVMSEAAAAGCREFDFGRSLVGSGAWSFKKNWGFEPRPLAYQFVAPGGNAVAPLQPDSAFNRVARSAWTRLPLAIANRLGPLVSRRLY